MREPKIVFNSETGETIATIQNGNRFYTGTAKCHPEDMPFCNHLTGEHIALTRAYIHYLEALRDSLVAEYKCLKHYYSCIKMHKNFDEKNYMVYTLLRTIKNTELELSAVRSEIKLSKDDIKKLVKSKEALYKNIKAKRNIKEDAE